MIGDGLQFMVIGMGAVFCFLILLVYVMQIMSAIIIRYFPEKEQPVAQTASAGSDRARIAAAIAIAMSKS